MAKILLVEDEANARRILSLALATHGHDVHDCDGPDTALQAMRNGRFDLVLTDLRMAGHDAGLDVVRMSAEYQPQARVLLLTAYASAETAVEAMKLGAFDYMTKPVSSEELRDAVERALAASHQENAAAPARLDTEIEMLVGESPVMQRIRERLRRAAEHDFTLLITGESGTGKEVAARFVHRLSRRRDGPFVAVHCGAIPETLFESELFGYRRGSFTGADTDRAGLIEAADGGTLFLDEVGEMPASVQVKLLRALQEKAVRRIGEDRERKVDIRVIAATNRDLAADVQQGNFREDLFYRLNVVPVHMPPLRQRREDIPLLAAALLRRWTHEAEPSVPAPVMQQLMQLPLLGNVRELENLLQRLLALSEGGRIDMEALEELYPARRTDASLTVEGLQRDGVNMEQALEGIERSLIEDALRHTGGNATQAAEVLGISFRSMRYRMKKLGLKE
ncbi:MAG TPA: sigma-54 dependent transcriptional regulator [Mariprofundaceae bacterium]|nr:sigma-54 dependent transcriptional regulator [Mariprofundaceae bacterium]